MVRAVPTRIAVVLGCSVSPDGRPGAAAARRCEAAFELLRDGRVDAILVTGGRRWHGRAEADVMCGYLAVLGVPPERLHAEACSLNTFENAWFSSLLLRAMGAREVTVVTCDFHLSRAVRTFHRLGIDATGYPATTPALTPTRRASFAVREALSGMLQRPLGALWEL